MPFQTGDRIGSYEISALLGEGGMGQVYRARDAVLKREVALKVLPDALARDPERIARFQREAEVLASLDHPHIAPIHGIVEAGGTRSLVLALVEGPTLAERIAAGGLPLDEALDIARQIIEALEYAHDRGVIHRDLKPANIKITPDGVVKVLDFGLAKVLEDERAAGSGDNSPTLSLGHTRVGMLLGTAAYMSPEQAVGKAADRRSDIFSFGSVLYEMWTGVRAFAAASTEATLVAVARDDPDWSRLPTRLPASLVKLLKRCLVKDRKQRLQAIGEARLVLASPVEEELAPQPIVRSRLWLWRTIAAVSFTALLALGIVHFRETPAGTRPLRYTIQTPRNLENWLFAVSPDGRSVAMILVDGGKRQIWARPLDSLEARLLPGTDDANYVFWSPDSRNLGFTTQRGGGTPGALMKIAISGGPPQPISPTGNSPRGGSWGADGTIVFAPGGFGGLYRIAASGGTPVSVTKAKEGTNHRYPFLLPDGRRFLYLSQGGPDEGVYVASLDSTETRRLLPDATNVEYLPTPGGGDGRLLFVRAGTLMAQPVDAETLAATGDAFPVAEQIGRAADVSGYAFSSSPAGLLTYRTGPGSEFESQLIWYDRGGKELGAAGSPVRMRAFSLSRDGTRVLTERFSTGVNADLWINDLAHNTDSRLTNGGNNRYPIPSPDGAAIAYTVQSAEKGGLYRMPSNGAGQPELLVAGAVVTFDWSRDGRYILYQRSDRETRQDIWALPLGGKDAIPVVRRPFNEGAPQLSPDGKWLAYVSDESGRPEVYVQAFLPGSVESERWAMSTGGGGQPRWRADGRELFFVSQEKLMAMEVKAGSGFLRASPQELFDSAALGGYAVRPDGAAFLVRTLPRRGDTITVDWLAGVRN